MLIPRVASCAICLGRRYVQPGCSRAGRYHQLLPAPIYDFACQSSRWLFQPSLLDSSESPTMDLEVNYSVHLAAITCHSLGPVLENKRESGSFRLQASAFGVGGDLCPRRSESAPRTSESGGFLAIGHRFTAPGRESAHGRPAGVVGGDRFWCGCPFAGPAPTAPVPDHPTVERALCPGDGIEPGTLVSCLPAVATHTTPQPGRAPALAVDVFTPCAGKGLLLEQS